ncbi:ribosome silencing factor [Chryseomicrobium excrementi]|uniref:Ribosomal silencing factor RsfS n=1 Tax=Chryseomicrobium excrementi TaxID=2041346 RepID=A0A2M9F238_9BACL|nr:ribosome silencing factor [Chryseomicrobium excrementi]PJK17530.1 ribosome silencing factor [Chryseomicrobium excrementi]
MNSETLMKLAAQAADDKKAQDIVVLNMQGVSPIADYFVICHANSDRQVQAIAKEIKDKAEEQQIHVKRMEGYDEGRWVLIDLGDVVAHVFHRDERDYYNLERLWGDAPIEFIELAAD